MIHTHRETRDTDMAIQQILEDVVKDQLKSDLPRMDIGDTINVHVRIIEGAKERIQVFNGVVIKMQGSGLTATVTVRRIVANEGVERTFPLHSPKVAKIEVKRRGDARRAKLYYLRDRVGKKRRLRDKRRGLESLTKQEAAPEAAEAKATADE